MEIKQVRSKDGTGTLSYLLIDEESRLAAVIDPNTDDVNFITAAADEEGVKITHILDTHTHADHYSAAGRLREIYGAKVYMHEKTKNKLEVLKNAAKYGIEDILNHNANIYVDVYVNEGDVITVGNINIKVLYTPGHTDNHIAFLSGDALFTGDLLLIGQAGRSDLPGGNTSDQYDSLFNKITALPSKTRIYPGHDYEDNVFSLLQDELKTNPFLQPRTKEEYISFVKDFFPPFAETAEESGKVTLQCGAKRVEHSAARYKNISSSQLFSMLSKGEDLFLLDVREPFELFMGKIDGVKNIPVGKLPRQLDAIPEKSNAIVCICASGNRSVEAAHFLSSNGYTNVYNLEGGTFGWLQHNFVSDKLL